MLFRKFKFLILLFMVGAILLSAPKKLDSDGDGYSDIQELKAGTNPNDASSLIYFGGWPFNMDKDSHKTRGFEANCPGDITCDCLENSECFNENCMRYPRGSYCSPKVGTKFPRFQMMDQFGDMVDIYDFANQGKYILLEISAAWCAPCNQLSDWLTFGDPAVTSQPWWKPAYLQLKPWIDEGRFYMINIQYSDEYRDNATLASIQDWYSQYPHDVVPLLADSNKNLHSWIKPTGIPTAILLNDQMEIVQPSSRGLNEAFDKLIEILNLEKK